MYNNNDYSFFELLGLILFFLSMAWLNCSIYTCAFPVYNHNPPGVCVLICIYKSPWEKTKTAE
jgi:hypothetical protein